jgi:ammonia channel protein AmtB
VENHLLLIKTATRRDINDEQTAITCARKIKDVKRLKMLYLLTVACITVALVLGSIVDRMKFSSWIVFTVLWVTFIYCPIAHWVWGGGWMGKMGALATGLFANPAITEGATGLFYGNPKQLWIQVVSILATAAFTAVGTLMVVYVTRFITGGIRVKQEEEIKGLDSSLHWERL